jgi:hypothetical protein
LYRDREPERNIPEVGTMERWQRARKALALLVAVVLIAGFVLYRSGVIGPRYMSSSKSTFVFVGSNINPTSPPPATDKKGE